MPSRSSPNAYIRFVNLMRAISVLPSGITLDAQEERLLQELAVRWDRRERVPVHEAIALLPDGSASTGRRRLKTLVAKGLIALEENPQDGRVKDVVATRSGRDYIARLGQLMQQAVRRS